MAFRHSRGAIAAWQRRALAVVAAFCLPIAAAIGTEVPRDLQAALKPFATLSVAIEGQTLRVVMNQPTVWRSTYESVAWAYCAPIHGVARRPWGGLPLRGVEVVNVTQAQGYAFLGTVVDCTQWRKLPPDGLKAFLEQRTLVCLGPECRPRRPGEVVVGDVQRD